MVSSKQSIKRYSNAEWLCFITIMAWNSWWPIWGYSSTSLPFFLSYGAVFLLFLIFNKEKRWRKSLVFTSFILFIYFVLYQFLFEINLSSIFIVGGFLIASHLKREEGKNILDIVTWCLSISISISLPFWIFHQYISPIPVFNYLDIGSMKGTLSTVMANHFFFVTYDGTEAFRFYSLFDEPGVLGTLAALTLWGNQYNFKDKRIIIILIGSFFTFSMAFYILTLVGFFMSFKLKKSTKFMVLFLIGALVSILFVFLEDNIAFQQSVVYRFNNFEETGVNSRNVYETNQMWNNFIFTSRSLIGYSSDILNTVGAIPTSYKWFFMRYGIIGFLLVIFAYYKISKSRNFLVLATLFIFVLSFMQRPQLFSVNLVMLYSAIINTFLMERESGRKKNINQRHISQ